MLEVSEISDKKNEMFPFGIISDKPKWGSNFYIRINGEIFKHIFLKAVSCLVHPQVVQIQFLFLNHDLQGYDWVSIEVEYMKYLHEIGYLKQ